MTPSEQEIRDEGLTVEFVEGRLVIMVGVDFLAKVTVIGGRIHDPDSEFKVINANLFAKDVISELKVEDEDGTTLAHRMFDRAAENAINAGSEAIEYPIKGVV